LTDSEVKTRLAVIALLVVVADKFTVPLYLAIEESFIVEVWVVPAKTVKLDGEMLMLKFGVVVVAAGVGEEVTVCADAKLTLEQVTSSVIENASSNTEKIVLVLDEI